MDGLVCPRLAGFFRLTQKLKARIQKKTDSSGKDLCPICGCKSDKGNLCQACFMRSFRPIAYTRNIKVVERNEFFFGLGKDRRWRRKKRGEAISGETKDEIDKDILKMVLPFTNTFGNPLESLDNSGEFNLVNEKASDEDQPHALTDPPQPTSNFDQQYKTVELVPSSELFKIDLVEDVSTSETKEETLEPLPKLVPDFWEIPSEEEDLSHSMASKLKTFSVHVIKEVQRPFKEIFCDSNTNIITPSIDGRQEQEEIGNVSFSAELYQDVPQEDQPKRFKPPQVDCCQNVDTETQCANVAPDDQDRISFSKQLKQNAILELLKVAYKTNMILNSLFHYFKKVVESDDSSSENYEGDPKRQLDDGNGAADSKISVDSFFFPNRQSAILWGADSGKKTQESKPVIVGLQNGPLDDGSSSETEVISKSQATLSMLMNRTPWCSSKGKVSPNNQLQDNEGDFIGPCPGMQSIFMTAPDSPRDGFVTRKFHSEHSKLRLKHHPEYETKDDSRESWASSDLGFQPSSNTVANDTAVRDPSSGNPGFAQEPSSATRSNQPGKSLLDLVFGLNGTCIKPSLLPLPDCQQDLITLSSPVPSKFDILEPKTRKDADSQTALSSRHFKQEMNLLHIAFLDQLAHFSVQLVDSCKTFGHSWQTSFLAELVEHFQTACSIIGESLCQKVPSSDRLDELQDVSNQISISLAKLRAHPHSFVGDCSNHDISTLLTSMPEEADLGSVNTWV